MLDVSALLKCRKGCGLPLLHGWMEKTKENWAKLGKTEQNWGKLRKTGQNWAKLGKTGRNWGKLTKIRGKNWGKLVKIDESKKNWWKLGKTEQNWVKLEIWKRSGSYETHFILPIWCTPFFSGTRSENLDKFVAKNWEKLVKTGKNWEKLVKTGKNSRKLVKFRRSGKKWNSKEKSRCVLSCGFGVFIFYYADVKKWVAWGC